MILLNILRSSILIDVEGRWVDGPATPDVTAKPKILKIYFKLGPGGGHFPGAGLHWPTSGRERLKNPPSIA
jgi:hypothetical protein